MSLVLHYPLQESLNTNVVINNAGGTGTLLGASSTAAISNTGVGGLLSKAFNFPVGSYVDSNFTGALGDFTVMCWFKTTTGGVAYGRLMDKEYGDGFWIGRNISQSSFGGGIKEALDPYGHFTGILSGQWHHIAMSRSGTFKQMHMDGVLFATGAVSSTLLSPSRFAIGSASHAPGSWPYDGYIADVRIYDTALTTTEINEIRNLVSGDASPINFYEGQKLGGVTIKGTSRADTSRYIENLVSTGLTQKYVNRFDDPRYYQRNRLR